MFSWLFHKSESNSKPHVWSVLVVVNLIFDLIIKPARSSVFRWRHLGDFKSRHRSQISYFSLESGGQGLKGTLRTKDSQGSQREHMAEILKEDPNRERSFTQYKSSGYRPFRRVKWILSYSFTSTHAPTNVQIPFLSAINNDQHLLGLSEPISSPLLAHP